MITIIEVKPVPGLFGLKDAKLEILGERGAKMISAKEHYGKGWRRQLENDFPIPLADIDAGIGLGYRVVRRGKAYRCYHGEIAVQTCETIGEAREWLQAIIAKSLAW